jgi:hypothetical protein
MKVISLWQPWASLWVTEGAKRFETRGWSTDYRGEVAVAATAAVPRIVWASLGDQTRAALYRHLGIAQHPGHFIDDLKRLPRSAIVGVVTVSGMISTNMPDGLPYIFGFNPNERYFGNYAPNRWAWDTSKRVKLKRPIPFKGGQGLRNLPVEIEAQIREQL